ncbi:EAL domain-containing protein [Actinospica sp. MGRD01-02]|uniref:EAL domain-containing protein n=1 Tax=Actinospica acidithermotolerans TaxID=2828514 RepID=A0A941EKJ0_9ACTN|nr:EAL domain-containing protein [Actinospica acidithermotolerans]MBR7830784.1 EAL domain-containing protein [Actinospica acidithermotolerans]
MNSTQSSPQRIAAAWFKALAEIGGVPGSAARSRGLLQELAGRILAAPDKPGPMRELGAAGGRALVDGNYTQPESIATTVAVLEQNLPEELSRSSRTALYAGLASGYANALRERTRAEQELIRQAVLSAHRTGEGRFRAVFRNAALGIGVVDGTGRVLEVNERLARILGRDAPAVRGRTVDEFRDADDKPEFCAAVRDLLAGRRGHYSAEKRFTAADGTVTWTRMQASTVRAADGSVELLIMMFEDITEQRRMNQRLLHQATHDALTGLPNRTMLLDRLTELLDEAKPDERIGLAFLDLDGFKGVNDTLGHEAGDRLLAEVARRLSLATDPQRHLVARMGGDEFVILVERTTSSSCVTDVAKAALASLQEPIILDGRRLSISASLGLVERPSAGAKPVELLRAADMTLYWAKADGKGRFALFDQERNEREVARYALSQALPAALEHGELFLEYQPIVDLNDGTTCAMEALVRWKHPVRGLLGPGEFVPLAEDTGMIVALGRWVLRRAVEDAASWPPAPNGRRLMVAVNVAVRQVHEPDLCTDVTDALESSGLPAELLQLEITESAVMNPGEGGRPALETLQALSELGVRIAIDDFGTGYSNLAYLHRLPASTLKIDYSFVKALTQPAVTRHDSAEAIVTSLITLAHACGMTVTAEGVETAVQAAILRNLGAERAQGFLYSRAVPHDRVPELCSGFELAETTAQG